MKPKKSDIEIADLINPLAIAKFSTPNGIDGAKQDQKISINEQLILLDKEETEQGTLEKTMNFRLFAYATGVSYPKITCESQW